VPEELDPLDSIGEMVLDTFGYCEDPDPEEVAERCGFYRMSPDVIADEQLEIVTGGEAS
jgi:hypothetical protein